jgi:hypothetical protein
MFEEQPDGDPHGECAAEIHRLQAENAALQSQVNSFYLGSPESRLLAMTRERDEWRARFEWLAAQHWVEPEATFRLNLGDLGDDAAQYMAQVVAAVDARLKPPNAPTQHP